PLVFCVNYSAGIRSTAWLPCALGEEWARRESSSAWLNANVSQVLEFTCSSEGLAGSWFGFHHDLPSPPGLANFSPRSIGQDRLKNLATQGRVTSVRRKRHLGVLLAGKQVDFCIRVKTGDALRRWSHRELQFLIRCDSNGPRDQQNTLRLDKFVNHVHT